MLLIVLTSVRLSLIKKGQWRRKWFFNFWSSKLFRLKFCNKFESFTFVILVKINFGEGRMENYRIFSLNLLIVLKLLIVPRAEFVLFHSIMVDGKNFFEKIMFWTEKRSIIRISFSLCSSSYRNNVKMVLRMITFKNFA